MSKITPLRKGKASVSVPSTLAPKKAAKVDKKAARAAKKEARKGKFSNFVSNAKNVVSTLRDNIQIARDAGGRAPQASVSVPTRNLSSNMTKYLTYGAIGLVACIVLYKVVKK